MSHGPCGLGGRTPGLVLACCAIVKVAPTSVSTTEIISARSILVFIFILSALNNGPRHFEDSESPLSLCSPIPPNFLPGIGIPPDPDLAPSCPAVSCEGLVDICVSIRVISWHCDRDPPPSRSVSDSDGSSSLRRFFQYQSCRRLSTS